MGGGLREGLSLVLLLAAGLVPRLAFVSVFPTVPISDFRGLVNFALAFADGTWIQGGRPWELYSPGLPAALSLVLRVSPLPPDDTARLATAIVCGLVPLLPFALWRGVLPLWVRLLAGGALALWPGQAVFSGVVAQDNWVLVPTVALGALMVRALSGGGRYPLAAGLLYGLGTAVRQEMLVALLPLFLGASLGPRDGGRWRGMATAAAVSAAALLGLASLRHAATGRFALTSEHSGLALLGAYVPGATANYWADPLPYIASVEPSLLPDRKRMQEAGFRLAAREALRRPRFHALRIASTVVKFSIDAEASNFYWSLGAAEVLPASHRVRADAFISRAVPWLRVELACLQALFLAALLVGVRHRNAPILLLTAAIVLKVGLHAVVVAQGRYFLAVIALEMLAISLGAWEAVRGRESRFAAAALALGTGGALLLFFAAPRLEAAVQARDVEGQRTYRFPLTEMYGAGTLDCVVGQGRLTDLTPITATLETPKTDPSPGERAEAVCTYTHKPGQPPVDLQVLDPYEPGGLPDRMRIEVRVQGVPTLLYDIAAEPGSRWLSVPLPASPGSHPAVRLTVLAVRPDPGAGWGRAARTTFRLTRREGS